MTCVLSPTGLVPWFSKTKGSTYATLLHHPFLFRENQHSAQEVAFAVRRHHVMIGCDKLYVQIQRVQVVVNEHIKRDGRNPSCYLLSTVLVLPEEEGMMQQSGVSISLSF